MDADFTQGDVGNLIGWTKVMVSRTERGLKRLSETELSTIFRSLGVSGPVSQRLLRFARELPLRDWWETDLPEMTPNLASVLDFERTATAITTVGVNLVPPLLRTPDYVRSVFAATEMDSKRIEERVWITNQRQRVLDGGVRLTGILDEAVLRRPVGGREVLADQLRQLTSIAERSNVTLLVLPGTLGAHPLLEGPFDLLRFGHITPVAHLATHTDTVLVENSEQVRDYERLITLAHELAKSPEESLELLATSVERAERGTQRARR